MSTAAAPPAVVIVNWNRGQETLRSLSALQGWHRPPAEVWVVDNGSEDGSVAAIRHRFPGCRLIEAGTNLGYGAANNRALEAIGRLPVLLLNNDASIGEQDVARMTDLLEREPGVGIVGPLIRAREETARILSAGGRDISRHIRTNMRLEEAPSRSVARGEPYDVAYVPGTVALLAAGLTDRTGPLDEEYFFGGELADLCERARRAGLRSVILPAASAVHDSEVAGDLRTELYPYYILRNRFRFVRKFRRRSRLLLLPLWTAYGKAAAIRALAQGRPDRARALLLGLVDGLAGRYGNQNRRVAGR